MKAWHLNELPAPMREQARRELERGSTPPSLEARYPGMAERDAERRALLKAEAWVPGTAVPKALPTESQEQAAVVEWFRLTHPGMIILAIPNGAHLGGDEQQRAIQMARLKREGLEAGAADLLVAVPRFDTTPPSAGLWLEMKSLSGKPSAEQLAFGDRVRLAGYEWGCCRGAEQAIRLIRTYLGE